MIHNLQLKNKSFFAVIILIFSILIFGISSCSNNAPQIRDARLSLIFDYDSMDSLPEARLSVFVESVSNPRRFDVLNVTPKGADISWEVTDLVLAENGEQKYCGAVNLVMPQDEHFPSGEYNIEFIQADDEKTEVKIGLFYDNLLYTIKAKDIESFMKEGNATKVIKIFDNSKKVLYYGPRTRELRDSRNIWNVFSEAAEFQETWIMGNIICNLPVEKVTPDN